MSIALINQKLPCRLEEKIAFLDQVLIVPDVQLSLFPVGGTDIGEVIMPVLDKFTANDSVWLHLQALHVEGIGPELNGGTAPSLRCLR